MVLLPPAHDELEVSLFGPGFGEAIVMHLGDGQWLLVDSCWLDRGRSVVVSAKYLEDLGVQDDQVRHVVATHWHDDHVGGIGSLIERYQHADFYFPSFLTGDEGREFVVAYSGTINPQTRGTKEIYRAFSAIEKAGRNWYPLHFRTIVAETQFAFGKMRIVALSPSGNAWAANMASVHSRLTSGLIPRTAPQPAVNLASIVLHIDYENEAVLLGSDLETHADLGWKTVVSHPWTQSRRKASLYKVAHHGSPTACIPDIWQHLVEPEAQSALTPFINGRVRLPGDADVARIKGYTPKLHATAPVAKHIPKATAAERQLTTFLRNATGRGKRMGHLRYRKKPGQAEWTCELDGAAHRL